MKTVRVKPLDKDQIEHYRNVGLEEMNKFHPIPGKYPYMINKRGIVINSKTNKRLSLGVTHKGYCVYVLYPEGIGRKQYFRHRLLMYTFKPHPNQDNLQVDHINGVPGDDRLENLDWVTGLENKRRYFTKFYETRKNEEKPKIVVKYFNFKDQSKSYTVIYKDKQDAMSNLKITTKEMNRRLCCKFGTLYDDDTMIKYDNDEREFPSVKDHVEYKLIQKHSNPCIGYNHITKEYKKFKNEVECAKFLGIVISSLTAKMNYYKNKIFKSGWEIKRLGEPLVWSKPTKDELKRIQYGLITSRPVEAIKGDQRLTFRSTKECADHFGYTLGGFNWCLKHHCDRPNQANGWMFRYIKQK